MIRFKVLLFTLTVLALVILAIVMSSCRVRRGDEFRIPADFSGWVRVDYDVAGAAPLRSSFTHRFIDVPRSGIVHTSSGRTQGYGLDKYLLIGPGNEEQQLRTEAEDCTGKKCILGIKYFSTPNITTMFFVGSQSEMDANPMPQLNDSSRPNQAH